MSETKSNTVKSNTVKPGDTKQQAKDKLKTGDSADSIFYPTDYVIAAFEEQQLIEGARDALKHAGFAENDLIVLDAAQMRSLKREKQQDEKHNPLDAVKSLLSVMGDDSNFAEQYIELADRGFSFLLAYAPDEERTARASDLIKSFKPQRARKYTSMTVVDLYPEISGH